MEEILKGLNDKQYEAVVNTEGPCLVIAGAGSGKTKVLTHKIAYLMGEKKILPWNILAITFTNKAAKEMKERIELLVGDAAKDMWIGTFHSICVRILRKFIDRIGFDSSFIIFDTSDQKTMVKQILKDLRMDDKMFTDRSVMSEISNAKNEMLEPDAYAVKVQGDFRKVKIAEVYERYQKRLKENNCKIKIVFGYKSGNKNINGPDEIVNELVRTRSLGFEKEESVRKIAIELYNLLGKENFVYSPPTHAKVVIVDEKYMFMGSHNWLSNAGKMVEKNRAKEGTVITTSRDAIIYTKEEFFADKV